MESGSSLWKSSRFEFNYRYVRATIAKGYDCTDVIIIFAFLFFFFKHPINQNIRYRNDFRTIA